MDNVSRGRLSPATLQDSLARFTRARGGEYTRTLTELNARFFDGLVQLSVERVDRPADSTAESVVEHLGRITRLYFDLLNGLTDVRTSYEEQYLREVLATANQPGQSTPLEINLIAEVGETTSSSFSVANDSQTRAIIRCTTTDVRRADGVGPAFSPAIAIAPDELVLDPGQEASVRLGLLLDASVYEPDALYVGDLHISRTGEPRLDVPLRVTALQIAPAADRSGAQGPQ
jgi:hypothetical protein